MAAVVSEMTDLNKPVFTRTDVKDNKNDVEESEIPLGPDLAAEEARKDEIRAKIHTVSEFIASFIG